jgi:ATPase subunit of ABC transporter with duplicated ATPase domains
MKIKSLHIADFNQFQNFSLDLTYPRGHAKAGKPLDKVCIIGQSGTGKTSLLRFMQEMTKIEHESENEKYEWQIKDKIFLKYGNNSFISLNIYDYTTSKLALTWHWYVDKENKSGIHKAVNFQSNFHNDDLSSKLSEIEHFDSEKKKE